MQRFLEFIKCKNFAEKAAAVLVQMPRTYLCEQGFSSLVEIKSKKKKKRNSILDISGVR